jgi:hypothetical protein
VQSRQNDRASQFHCVRVLFLCWGLRVNQQGLDKNLIRMQPRVLVVVNCQVVYITAETRLECGRQSHIPTEPRKPTTNTVNQLANL